MAVEDDHPDVLQNIESIVARIYRRHPELTDFSVLRVYEALTDFYSAEQIGRAPRPWRPKPLEQTLFDEVKSICDWRLGRSSASGDSLPEEIPMPDPIDPDTLRLCLKRLRKSVDRWNRQNGRQGYLNFMSDFVP